MQRGKNTVLNAKGAFEKFENFPDYRDLSAAYTFQVTFKGSSFFHSLALISDKVRLYVSFSPH